MNTRGVDTYDLVQPSSSSAKVSEESQFILFDLDSSRDLANLKEWAKTHWYSTIKKSMDSCNPAVYHECCFCFSRRTFCKRSGHRELESASVLRIPSLRSVKTPEDFFKWLLDKIKTHERLGRKTIYPAINKLHVEEEEPEEEECYRQTSMLAKRCAILQEENNGARNTIEQLVRDNSRLRESSRSWYERYAMVSERLENLEKNSQLLTPVKSSLCGEQNLFDS